MPNLIPATDLSAFVSRCLTACGMPEGDAAMTKIPDARRSAAKMAKDANDSQESGFG